MEIKLRKWYSYGYLDDIVLRVKPKTVIRKNK